MLRDYLEPTKNYLSSNAYEISSIKLIFRGDFEFLASNVLKIPNMLVWLDQNLESEKEALEKK